MSRLWNCKYRRDVVGIGVGVSVVDDYWRKTLNLIATVGPLCLRLRLWTWEEA